MQRKHPFDLLDLLLALLTAAVANVSGEAGAIAAVLAIAQYAARRSAAIAGSAAALGADPASTFWRVLIPGLDGIAPPSAAQQPTVTSADDDPFATPAAPAGRGAPASALAEGLAAALTALPTQVALNDLRPFPESHTAIPIGLDVKGVPRWIDFQAGAYHVGLYAMTRAGKDTLLRTWFLWLCTRNTPDQLQFVFLDGKGDWLTPNLAQLAHMWRPPAGGYGEDGTAAILTAITAIDAEAKQRQQTIFGAGYRTRERYIEATGKAMPLLIVVATDAMEMTAEVERLLASLVSKAAALGMRVVASMQTPTGKDMEWRMNLSTILAGCLFDESQDGPALGLRSAKGIRYRPSQLPPPGVRPGVFVVRSGGDQLLIQAPYVSEETFDKIVATLPTKAGVPAAASGVPSNTGILSGQFHPHGTEFQGVEPSAPAVGSGVPKSVPVPGPALDPAETALIAMELGKGGTASQVAKRLPGYHGRKHDEFKAKVETVQALLKKGDQL